MDFKNIDTRLDLDNQMKEVMASFEKQGDDAFFYIRIKQSTNELASVFCGEESMFAVGLVNLAMQRPEVMKELNMAFQVLIKSGHLTDLLKRHK
jgi:hypothetical protein